MSRNSTPHDLSGRLSNVPPRLVWTFVQCPVRNLSGHLSHRRVCDMSVTCPGRLGACPNALRRLSQEPVRPGSWIFLRPRLGICPVSGQHPRNVPRSFRSCELVRVRLGPAGHETPDDTGSVFPDLTHVPRRQRAAAHLQKGGMHSWMCGHCVPEQHCSACLSAYWALPLTACITGCK